MTANIDLYRHIASRQCDFCSRRAVFTYSCPAFQTAFILEGRPSLISYEERWRSCLRCSGFIDSHTLDALIDAAIEATRRQNDGRLTDTAQQIIRQAISGFWATRDEGDAKQPYRVAG